MQKNLCSTLITFLCLVSFAASALAETKSSKPFPKWDKQINTTQRFKVLDDFNGEAVLDNETGLVWERSPAISTVSWFDAQYSCFNAGTGGRLGWRIPTIEELASLVDRTQLNPALPIGHPFVNVQISFNVYWSSTFDTSDVYYAWVMNFGPGFVERDGKIAKDFLWCVRGGQSQ